MTANEISLRLAGEFNYRTNLIVPNISWGLGIHECDMLIVSKSGYATEVEIKVSKSDLVKDAGKRHGHRSNLIKRLYFAIPVKLKKHIELIPERAGIITIRESGYCEFTRKAMINKQARRLTEDERFTVARLGTMRIWSLSRRVIQLKKDNRDLREQKERTQTQA